MNGRHRKLSGLNPIFQEMLDVTILESMDVHMHAQAHRNLFETLRGPITQIKAPSLHSLTYAGHAFEGFIWLSVLELIHFISLTTAYMNVCPKVAEALLLHTFPNLTPAHFVVLCLDRDDFPPDMGAFEGIGFEPNDRTDPQTVPRLRSLTLETSSRISKLEGNPGFSGISRILDRVLPAPR